MVKHSNEDGSASGVVTLVFVFLLGGFLLIAAGYATDQLTGMLYMSGIFSSTPATQLRYDVVNFQVMVLRFTPVLILVFLGINQILESNREFSGSTPLSAIAIAAAEMIFQNVIIMAVTLFGGFALDKIVATMTGLALGAQQTGLYGGLIQYIPSVFYGVLFLATVGSCVLFAMYCIQVVDYSHSFS